MLMPNQMLALMKIAWDRCKGDINTVMSFVIGAGVFFVVWMFYALLNLGTNFDYALGQNFPPDAVMLAYAYWGSFINGSVNAASMLLFFAILVCLLEYTGNFIIVCWYYDDCSWETPYQIKQFLKSINRHILKVRKANVIEAEKSRNALMASIKSIKNNDEL